MRHCFVAGNEGSIIDMDVLDLCDTVVTGNEGSSIDVDVLDLCDTVLLQAMKAVALMWMF